MLIEKILNSLGRAILAADDHAAGEDGAPLQVAALPYRVDSEGCKVLLVTSRRAGRWILPKGWPYHGASLVKSAAREAYEEAGVQGAMGREEVGRFVTTKMSADGATSVAMAVIVYPLRVELELESWPEQDQRQRQWFALDLARDVIAAEQRHILAGFSATQ